MLLRPGTAIERYVVEGVLGQGAMAVVYRARHRDLGSLHAIKQLTHPDADISDRLVQEGRLQSSLRHPNVLSVTDLVQIDDLPALVMEYVAGPSLKELLEQTTLGLPQVDALVRGLLRGVAAAHGHGLVHRDLKPANILIAITDDALIPKVADFGLAKVLEGHEVGLVATKTGSSMGTPAYMAPEQILDSSSVDARADVFSLGAILYELVAGVRCFESNHLPTLWRDICAGTYVPVAERAPDLPQRMADAIEGALVTDREARVPTAAALLETWFGGAQGTTESAGFTQTLDVWTGDIRAKAAALASDASPASEPRATAPLAFDETVAAESAPQPTGGSTSPMGLASAEATTPGRPSPWPWALVAGVAIVAGVWALRSDAPPSQSEPAGATKAAAGGASSTVGPSTEPQRVFRLHGVEDKAARRRFAQAVEAILQGEIPRAERLLGALVKQHPNEPAVHSLLGLSHFFRRREALSVKVSGRAAQQGRDLDTDLGKVLVLANRSWREHQKREELLQQWQALRERSDDPMVEMTYFVAGRYLIGKPALLEALHASMKVHPDWVVLWLLELQQLNERGDLPGMLEATEAALRVHPASTAIQLRRYQTLARLGRLEEAEKGLKEVLVQDGSLAGARITLADVYLRMGREKERQTQIQLVLGDTTAPSDRLTALEEHGLSLANRGRLKEASRFWAHCMKWAQAEGLPHHATRCGSMALDALVWLGDPPTETPWTERLREVLTAPEIDDDIRQLHTIQLLWNDARRALHGKPSAQEASEALLRRLASFPDGALPFDLKAGLSDDIRFELRLVEGDAAGLKALLKKKLAMAKAYDAGPPCVLRYAQARVGWATADDAMATGALSGIVSRACVPGLNQGIVRARSRVELARMRQREGKTDEARGLLDDFYEAWPSADEDLPTVRLAEAVTKRLP